MLISPRFFAALSITLVFAEAAAGASHFARVEHVDEGDFTVPQGTFDRLVSDYNGGKYRELRAALNALVTSASSSGAYQFDLDRNHYSFAFVTPNPLKSREKQLVRVFTYAGGYACANREGGATDIDFGDAVLPGITTFYDVYLRTDPSWRMATTCTYVEVESPLYADFLKFTKQIAFGQIAGFRFGGAQPGGSVEGEHVYFSVARVTVPARRSNITLTSAVNPDQPEPIKNTTTYTNAPLRRLSFGAVAAGMFTHDRDARVKISDDKFAADPLSGAMSVAAIYIHPIAYVAETAEPSLGERLRFLVGYVATPEPGLALGGGLLLFRGVTVNAGYSYMLVNALPANAHVGDAVTTARPFKRGYAGSLFAGFGYNFQ